MYQFGFCHFDANIIVRMYIFLENFFIVHSNIDKSCDKQQMEIILGC